MMSWRAASETVAITDAAATDCRNMGWSKMRLRRVKCCGSRKIARSCTTTTVGHGEASGIV